MENFDVYDLPQRPIVVGYAFGAKKMRSMGMVMAEASKAQFYPPPIHELDDDDDDVSEDIVVIDLGKKQKLHHVVRHFQQSCCSSIDGGDASSSGLTTTTISDHNNGVTVSFVPLDPDIPIEEQHCGEIDIIIHIIIHKLTEDILAWEDNERASTRVERLLHFCAEFHCQLVDDPRAVRTVLSRAEIATRLMSLHLTTVSGIQVSTPPFSTSSCFTSLRYPVIAKPLTAAGTKGSHSMKVLLRKPSMDVFQEPLLFQEYINHDAVLYKIYVLGNNISVFERSSLPNLPTDQFSTLDAVEFDSQRHPYPSLASFGFEQRAIQGSVCSDRLTLTSTEIQPVVVALKDAFQLQLFGFDIIYGDQKLWIVDVNYFPSYKEVSNFPALLAEYLTDRVLAQRENAQN